MIRLIASDLDGTLLEPVEHLPEGLFELEGHQQRKYDSGQKVPLPEIPEPRGFIDKVS